MAGLASVANARSAAMVELGFKFEVIEVRMCPSKSLIAQKKANVGAATVRKNYPILYQLCIRRDLCCLIALFCPHSSK